MPVERRQNFIDAISAHLDQFDLLDSLLFEVENDEMSQLGRLGAF